MNIIENIKMAFHSIAAQKLRALLTTLGIIIGVAAVIMVVAIGQGAEQKLKAQIVGVENIREIYFEPSEFDEQENPNIYAFWQYSEQDVTDIQALPSVQSVVASSAEHTTILAGDEKVETEVNGINMHYMDLYDYEALEGNLLHPVDYLTGTRKAVITSVLAEQLFPYESAVGQTVKVGAYPIEIVGVLAPSDSIINYEREQLLLPYETWKQIFFRDGFDSIHIKAETVEDVELAVVDAAAILNENHSTVDAYKSYDMSEFMETDSTITRVMTVIIGGIAGISLLVGGIGVMNIMLVSVTERTREIGIRKSMGATRGQILFQFLIESIVLTVLGGTAGILLGALLVQLIGNAFDMEVVLSGTVVLIATAFSLGVGILFGILPANKAAKLDPVESLRYE
ncbi:ABC transporter permease [Shouchella clausii]|uniref:ABC transporter permease n=1 Tax=Shouchella clausii TaxID=79880 RepID=UPI00280A861B|nr:ABC transporter permease [Shouchella clausii]WMM31223.1 ABC transporter permease [Shouchella clausii]